MKIKRGTRKMAKFRVIKNRKAYFRRRRIRRFLTLAVIVTIFAYAAHSTYASRMNRLEEVRAELAAYQEEYADVMLRQGFYENQVIRLQDEDYIAMLARERHFMSLPNEIIFTFRDAPLSETTDENSSEITDEYDEN